MAILILQNVKDYLNITDSSRDIQINLVLPMVDAAVERFTRRAINTVVLTGEQHNGRGTPYIFPRKSPIQSVEKFELIDPTDGTTVRTIGPDEFNIMTQTTTANSVGEFLALIGAQGIRNVFRHPWNGPVLPTGINNINLDYTAGYFSGAIPPDIQLAALHTMEFHINQTSSGLRSEKIGDYAQTKFDPGVGGTFGGIPPSAAELLRPFKRLRFEPSTNAFGEVRDVRAIEF